MAKDSEVKSIFVKKESNFINQWGEFNENSPVLATGVTARLDATTNDFHILNLEETEDSLDDIGWHVNDDGRRWWSDQNNQVFGTENTYGSSPWSVYKQTNIYTTARKYAGKDGLYGMHIFRYPNIDASSTWGGLRLYPPASSKLSGNKYRLSFDYRGYSGGYYMDVYQNYEVGWGNIGINLPGAWSSTVAPFDTWDWQRYEKEFEISDELLNFIPGQNTPEWDPTREYTGSWYGIRYDGYVYRHHSGRTSQRGVTPEEEYANQSTSAWTARYPQIPGYLDIYRQIKIGFTYHNQNDRGTHVYIDNIHLTNITTNERFKFNDNKWEADNLSEETTHILAHGTGYVSQPQSGNAGVDKFNNGGSRSVSINGTSVSVGNGRGLNLTIIRESDSAVTFTQTYDTYGTDSHRTNLANKLKTITDDYLWVLTSFDAVGSNSTLNSQMKNMKSKLHLQDGSEHCIFSGSGVRHTYAAIGRGQTIIKEDGANADDPVYKRMGVIDIRI